MFWKITVSGMCCELDNGVQRRAVGQQPGISIRLRSAPSFLQSASIRRSSAVRGKSSGGTVSRAILSIIQACTVRARSLISGAIKRISGGVALGKEK
jgi:hypothetical protein